MKSADAAALEDLLKEGLRDGVAPALSAWIAVDGQPRAVAAAGDATPATVFDLASLTKPLVIVTQVMVDVGRGRYGLDDAVDFAAGQTRSYRELLGHRSGLPAWEDLWAVATSSLPRWQPGHSEVWRVVEDRISELLETRAEPNAIYSDLGYIQLGRALEREHGKSLRELARTYGPVPEAAPTRQCPRRQVELRGHVHDLNCWVLGGAAGHAGTFACAADVGAWALDLLRSASGQGGSLDSGVVREFWSHENRSSQSTWVLGWDTPSSSGSSGGQFMSDQAIGHLGFTGTSVWLDPACGFAAVLLTNRVSGPEGSQERVRAFRRRFHDEVRAHFDLI
jgi:CubicO group peptidase (beta-lactamase class C family)